VAFFFGVATGASDGGVEVAGGGGGGNCADADTIATAMARTAPAQKREVLVMIYFSEKLAL
jgi:hypothetical protein